jgi:hypothetical protein
MFPNIWLTLRVSDMIVLSLSYRFVHVLYLIILSALMVLSSTLFYIDKKLLERRQKRHPSLEVSAA